MRMTIWSRLQSIGRVPPRDTAMRMIVFFQISFKMSKIFLFCFLFWSQNCKGLSAFSFSPPRMKSVLKRVFSPKPPKSPIEPIDNQLPPQMMSNTMEHPGGIQFKYEDFIVHRCLGTGSFGRVNLVLHAPTGNFYAMKKLRKSEIVRLRQVEHTNAERRLLAQVNYPFIVKMACTFQDAFNLYIVMEYVCGGELFSLLRRVRTLPPFVAQFYAAQIVLAIEHLHSQNIVYRDLKPENILIDKDGYVKMTDFGFAKVVPEATWTLCGTPDYLAPEVVQSLGYGKAVDWYAIGILIYEMLIGSPPFYNENNRVLYDNIIHKKAYFPSGFDWVAQDLIERLLEKDPHKRLGAFAGGAADIKAHPWFRDVNWEQLEARQLRPPFKPKIAGDGDASNFDQYPDEVPQTSDIDPQQYAGLFPDF